MVQEKDIDGWDDKNNQNNKNNNQDLDWEQKVSKEDFESIKKSNQEAQKLIKSLTKEKVAREQKDKDSEQLKLEEKWEFEKLKIWREKEKEDFVSIWSSKDELLEKQNLFIKQLAEKQIEGLKDQLGDNYKDIESLVNLENPMEVLEKIPTIKKLLIKDKPKADSGIGKWNKPDRLEEIRKKLSEWTATRREIAEMTKLVWKQK